MYADGDSTELVVRGEDSRYASTHWRTSISIRENLAPVDPSFRSSAFLQIVGIHSYLLAIGSTKLCFEMWPI